MGLLLMHRVYPSMRQRTLRRIFIATLLSTTLGVGTAVLPAQAAPTAPSTEATPTAPHTTQTVSQPSEASPTATPEASASPSPEEGTAPSAQGRRIARSTVASEILLEPQRNTTQVRVRLGDDAAADIADTIDTVHVRATMNYRGKVTREIDKKIPLAQVQEGNYSLDFGTFGKFTASVTLEKNGNTVRTLSDHIVGVTADSYNIAPVSATLPVAMFSLNLWGENSIRKSGPVIAMFERPNAYNWKALPGPEADNYGVYGLPYLSEKEIALQPGGFDEASQQFRDRIDIVADYVRDLRELDPSSTINLYVVDVFVNVVQKVIYANQIPQDRYTIRLITDGAYSYVKFPDVYQDGNPKGTHERLVREWKDLKAKTYAKGRAEYPADSTWEMSPYLWAMVDSEPNAQWWLSRPKLLSSPGDGDAFAKEVQSSSKVKAVNISALLKTNIAPSAEATAQFKALYNFNDGYFNEAEEQGKEVMLMLGTHLKQETGFEDYARFTQSYYGDRYLYYYKGHPATPTELSTAKQDELKRLEMTDVDASIAAELILFFNPGIDVAGYESSTFASTQPGKAKGVFNLTKTKAMESEASPYRGLEYWIVPMDKAESEFKKLCPGGHTCYQVEFSDSISAKEGYTHALWDATDSVIIYYKKNGNSFEKIRVQNGVGTKSSVEAGEYYIKSTLADDLVLDVWAASRNDGANVQLWKSNLSAAQKWRVSYDAEGLVTITNVASGKVLDAQWGSSRPGTNVAQWSNNGSRAQKWKIVTGDKGRITIVSALDPSIVLDISAGGRFSGANVQLWTANGSDAQTFAFIPTKPSVSAEGQADITPGYYSISSVVNPDMIMALADYSLDNGAKVHAWTNYGFHDQMWKISRDGDGYYRLENVWSGKSLDSTDGTPIPGRQLQVWTTDLNNPNQKWVITSVTGGAYMLRNVGTGLVVDLSAGIAQNGRAIDGYLANGTTAQQWRLDKLNDPISRFDDAADATRGLVEDGIYEIEPIAAPGKRLDVQWGSKDAGARVWLYSANGSAAQKWRVSHDAQGYVIMTNLASGKVLDVYGASKAFGTKVTQQPANGTHAQKWMVVETDNGDLAIASAVAPLLFLDLEGGRNTDGTPLQTYGYNGSKAQRFRFIKQ